MYPASLDLDRTVEALLNQTVYSIFNMGDTSHHVVCPLIQWLGEMPVPCIRTISMILRQEHQKHINRAYAKCTTHVPLCTFVCGVSRYLCIFAEIEDPRGALGVLLILVVIARDVQWNDKFDMA